MLLYRNLNSSEKFTTENKRNAIKQKFYKCISPKKSISKKCQRIDRIHSPRITLKETTNPRNPLTYTAAEENIKDSLKELDEKLKQIGEVSQRTFTGGLEN